MAVSVPNTRPKYPKQVNSKIVGTTFEGRQEKLARCQREGVQVLHLRLDYANKFDPDAVAVEAHLENEVIQLGFLSNSDRACVVCGRMLDGAAFSRSKIVKCPDCGKNFQFTKAGVVECPECNKPFKTEEHKTIPCPTCYGDEWIRDGLASVVSRAMRNGVEYMVRVQEYTGGDINEKTGKTKTRGCNIKLEQLEKDQPV